MFQMVFQRDIIKRSLGVAAVVGTVLNIINQGNVLVATGTVDTLKCILTYLVPYCVATYSAVSALTSQPNSNLG